MLAQEIIARKRDGHDLSRAEIAAIIQGISDGSVSDAQTAAFAMAVYLQGMKAAETVDLTLAMRDSGKVLCWEGLDGPVLDKHSTGGIGDKVSLILAPILAACGGYVPMLSGRGLGHTGGTLDKLEAIPGYDTRPDLNRLQKIVRDTGLAIVGQTDELAPADRKLYAIRDVTATVESLPLITASILSKKLAANPEALVMDIKCGTGAFMAGLDEAQALGRSIVDVANGAGLACTALMTDMNECLGNRAGNALEVLEVCAALNGENMEARLREVTFALAAELLVLGGLSSTLDEAHAKAGNVLKNGQAREAFAKMVTALGGPADFLDRPSHYLPAAPIKKPLLAKRSGYISGIDAKALGFAVIDLGGGRRVASDRIDPSVGLADVIRLGSAVRLDTPLLTIHGRDDQSVTQAAQRLCQAFEISDGRSVVGPAVIEKIG